ncbi:MAG TPA: ATP-binding protein [Blastocatellia bacterium]|nr:ATP-binding protein [Blastocatellia bacterium]
MTPIQILKLVGFATGATLHLYIAWLIWNRRLGSREKLTQPVQLITILNICLGVWFLGNLFITFHELLLTANRLTGLLRAWDTLAMTGVALLPAALLHAHVGFWASLDNYRTLKPRAVRLIGVMLYIPMIFLPYAIYRINSGDYRPYFLKLRVLLIPYSIWYLLVMISSALIDWSIKDRLNPRALRERAFFKRLAILLVLNGIFEFVVVAILRTGPNDVPWVLFLLSSLLPIFFVAYHVYRYKLVDVAIKDSLVYAMFALVFIAVYTYGVRRLDQFLVDRFGITAGVVEVILILGMVALASPLVRVIDQMVHRLFTTEIGLYRDVVRQVSSGAEGFGELASLIRYTDETIRRGLDLTNVRVLPVSLLHSGSHEARLAEKMTDWNADVIETDDDLQAVDATIAYALRRELELVGLMLISAEPHALTSEKRAILDVLASQVAVEVESCRLIEEKVRLERELVNREHLAKLGQMAAQVAHEVKNPLSSIKSIAQVMREDESLSEFDQDLSLIVSEIDRLNRTVSQLLAFSRPSHADSRPVRLSDLMSASVTIAGAEARERGVDLRIESITDVVLTGAQGGALREALSNLVLNAAQATETGGEVVIRATLQTSARESGVRTDESIAGTLAITVTDTGPGIPADSQQRVFEPFYSTKSRGTGLGLAIVQRRVVEIGGSVELVSPVANSRGTQFRLIIPLAAAESGMERGD